MFVFLIFWRCLLKGSLILRSTCFHKICFPNPPTFRPGVSGEKQFAGSGAGSVACAGMEALGGGAAGSGNKRKSSAKEKPAEFPEADKYSWVAKAAKCGAIPLLPILPKLLHPHWSCGPHHAKLRSRCVWKWWPHVWMAQEKKKEPTTFSKSFPLLDSVSLGSTPVIRKKTLHLAEIRLRRSKFGQQVAAVLLVDAGRTLYLYMVVDGKHVWPSKIKPSTPTCPKHKLLSDMICDGQHNFSKGRYLFWDFFSFFGGIFFLFLVPWSPGPLIPWCPGHLVPLHLVPSLSGPQCPGPLDPWSSGPLVPWSPGPLVLWSPAPLVFWSPGPLFFFVPFFLTCLLLCFTISFIYSLCLMFVSLVFLCYFYVAEVFMRFSVLISFIFIRCMFFCVFFRLCFTCVLVFHFLCIFVFCFVYCHYCLLS